MYSMQIPCCVQENGLHKHNNYAMKNIIWEIAITALLVIFVFFLITVSLQNTMVVGPSMEPTVKNNQRIFVNKMVYIRFSRDTVRHFLPWVKSGPSPEAYPFHPPRRGEIIVFHPPGQPDAEFIKRVIAVAGDQVELRRGQVILNGVVLTEPYIVNKSFPTETRAAVTVPIGSFYVLGDNRPQSEDSRAFGPVPQDNIIGKAWVTYWPRSKWGFIRSFKLDNALPKAQSINGVLVGEFLARSSSVLPTSTSPIYNCRMFKHGLRDSLSAVYERILR